MWPPNPLNYEIVLINEAKNVPEADHLASLQPQLQKKCGGLRVYTKRVDYLP